MFDQAVRTERKHLGLPSRFRDNYALLRLLTFGIERRKNRVLTLHHGKPIRKRFERIGNDKQRRTRLDRCVTMEQPLQARLRDLPIALRTYELACRFVARDLGVQPSTFATIPRCSNRMARSRCGRPAAKARLGCARR
jgi:hypothetical protein